MASPAYRQKYFTAGSVVKAPSRNAETLVIEVSSAQRSGCGSQKGKVIEGGAGEGGRGGRGRGKRNQNRYFYVTYRCVSSTAFSGYSYRSYDYETE